MVNIKTHYKHCDKDILRKLAGLVGTLTYDRFVRGAKDGASWPEEQLLVINDLKVVLAKMEEAAQIDAVNFRAAMLAATQRNPWD
jgi:hypothetical protein